MLRLTAIPAIGVFVLPCTYGSYASGVYAQEQQQASWAQGTPEPPSAIVVEGRRGSAVSDIAAIAEIDDSAITAIGASSMAELQQAIQGQTRSSDGSEPILLLNAQRVSGYEEIGSLPPEAIEKIEVLPEQAALRFGFPPTRRVVNFITKRRFKQIEAKASIGTTLPAGRTSETARAGYTRLRDNARLTANLEYQHADPLNQSERRIAPDPDLPFDALGNITGVDGGEVDAALSAAAGQPVTIAPVPADPAQQGLLAAYAAGANQPRLYPLGRYATLSPGNDTIKGEAVLAGKVGETMGGSLTLSVEHSRDRALYGPESARLVIPADNPFSPFAGPVILNRYIVEAGALRQRETKTTVNAGAKIRGALAGWQWDATVSLNQVSQRGVNERGLDLTAANAAIASGADPFVPLDPALIADRQTDRTHERTRSVEAKLVAVNAPLDVPAGPVNVSATVEAGWLSANSSLEGTAPFALRLERSRLEAGLGLDVPLTSRKADVLPSLGDISLNASANLRRVSGFGSLNDSTFGVTWVVLEGLQFLANIKRSAAAPDLAQQAAPPRTIETVPIFDFSSGRTEIVTLFLGGNPDLLAERRRIQSLGLNVKPFATSQLRVGVSYDATTIRNQAGVIQAITPQTEALLPDLFRRDAAGRLISVAFRPINYFLERQRKLQLTLTASGSIGKLRTPAASGGAGTEDKRPKYYSGIVPSVVFQDELQLRPGTAALDLLHGDSVGSYTPRVSGYAYGGINAGGYGATINAYYGGARRIRGASPAADLRFMSIFKIELAAYLPMEALVSHADWARHLQLRLNVANVTDSRQRVRDANGAVPNRYQTDLIDPLGRTVTLSLRKRI